VTGTVPPRNDSSVLAPVFGSFSFTASRSSMPLAARRSGSKRKLRPETEAGSFEPSASAT